MRYLSLSSASVPPPLGFLAPSFSASSSFFPASLPSSSGSLSSHNPPVHPPFPVSGSAVVHGLGVGVPSSSGVPPFPLYSSAATAHSATTSAAWPPASTYSYDPHASAAPPPHADPLDDHEEQFPEDERIPLDPSAPPLSLYSARSEYRRMVAYICGLFLLVSGVPPVDPPPRALFESFFAPVPPASQSLAFNWFERVCTALIDADASVASLLASVRPERLLLPQRMATYVVRGECATGRAVPGNESLLAHMERPLRPTLHLGLTVWDAMALEASFRAQSEALLYSMWVLSGLLGFVCLQGFIPADPALFNQLVTALSKSLAHQAQVSASHTSFLCHRRREFYLSHLPAYFSDINKCLMLSSPAVFTDTLFCEEDVARLLESTRSSSSLKSQQAMVDVASRRSSAPASRQRRSSPGRSPHLSHAKRRRQSSGSPSRQQKRVRFDSPAPSSAMKSQRKSHFRGYVSHPAG